MRAKGAQKNGTLHTKTDIKQAPIMLLRCFRRQGGRMTKSSISTSSEKVKMKVGSDSDEATASSFSATHPMPSMKGIRETTFLFWASRILSVAVEMSLFTELSNSNGGLTHAEIVQLLCWHDDIRADVLDLLVSVNLLERKNLGATAVYSNTPETEMYLVRTHKETYIGDSLEACGGKSYAQWIDYPESLRSDKKQAGSRPTVREMMQRRDDLEQRFASQPLSCKEILRVGFGFVHSRVLHAAVELNVFGALHDQPEQTALQLRHSLSMTCTIERSLDFLGALVAMSLLQVREGTDQKQSYSNKVAATLYLVPHQDQSSLYFGNFARLASARMYPFWRELSDALTTGMNQNEFLRTKAFEALYSTPAVLEMFVESMISVSAECRYAFLKTFECKAHYRTMVDVGGGAGHLACTLAQQYAQFESCVTTDLPPVGPVVNRYIEAFGAADRVRFQGYDYRDDVGIPSADVIVMCIVLHDASLPVKKQLVRKAFEALPEDGVFVVIDPMIDDGRCVNTFAMGMSLNMLIEMGEGGGFDYTSADLTSWCLEAGFRRVETQPLGDSDYSMALVYKH